MEKIKKWIIILAVMMVILVIALIVLLNSQKNKDSVSPGDLLGEAEESVEIETNVVQVKDSNTFYTIEKNMQSYFLYLKVGNSEAVYEMLSKDYLAKNNLTQENILNHLPKIQSADYEFSLKQLYLNDSNTYPVYYAKGELLENSKKQEQYLIIYVDQIAASIAVEPITKQEYETKLKANKENEEKQIQRNNYNKLSQISVNNEEIAKKYFKNYIYNALHDVNVAYNSLDEQYKKVKYGSLEEYKKHIAVKQEELISMDLYSIKKQEDFQTEEQYIEYLNKLEQKGLHQYAVSKEANYTQYVCIDDYGNYYIFNETAPMQYSVILDTYTVDLPQFTAKYANSTAEQKVLLNIQKFFEAINTGDYKYAYRKLDQTFKTNNFSTELAFENYVKTNFFTQNKLAAGKADIQNDLYIYQITITDASGKNTNKVTKSFVMQLKEGTDFVMSFSK